LGAAVSALYSNMNRPFERRVHGLVRFIQADDEQCIIEGTVDGLLPNSRAQINIHEYGDLSNGCDRYLLLRSVIKWRNTSFLVI
jgi:hypothetical protein